ncbi:carbohydrate ABC transporter permease [Vibrio sp. 1S139]|uniref:carbohydrate ABC transporter permease n=1 Tax=Vibrio sp. 1S139 TaxID=3230006 RepID=UPI00352E1974
MTTQVLDANQVLNQSAAKAKVIAQTKATKSEVASKKISVDRRSFLALAKHLFLATCGTIMVFPFLWMLSGSLKSNDEIFANPLDLIPEQFRWETFVETFHSAPFGLYIFNSFSVALFTTFLVIVNSAMFAYALTQLKFRSKTVLYFIVMGCYMLPGAASVFGVFYLRQVFIKVHPSLIEAARIDGAGELKILWAIILPQCRAAVATLFLITFITNYNSYMWPSLVITTQDLNLIATGIRHYFIAEGNYGLNWSQIMAASTIAVLPLLILFVICQKTILSGIADNGVKE